MYQLMLYHVGQLFDRRFSGRDSGAAGSDLGRMYQ
jgi:hypothetical protein